MQCRIVISRLQTGLCRAKIGEFLGLIGSRLAMDTLEAYVKLFQYESEHFDECLRKFLGSFRLPGEV